MPSPAPRTSIDFPKRSYITPVCMAHQKQVLHTIGLNPNSYHELSTIELGQWGKFAGLWTHPSKGKEATWYAEHKDRLVDVTNWPEFVYNPAIAPESYKPKLLYSINLSGEDKPKESVFKMSMFCGVVIPQTLEQQRRLEAAFNLGRSINLCCFAVDVGGKLFVKTHPRRANSRNWINTDGKNVPDITQNYAYIWQQPVNAGCLTTGTACGSSASDPVDALVRKMRDAAQAELNRLGIKPTL